MNSAVVVSRSPTLQRAIGIGVLSFLCGNGNALAATTETPTPAIESESTAQSSWYESQLSLIGSKDMRYGPKSTDDIFAEYEYFGQVGPVSLYGYMDVPKILGVGNSNDKGVWDKGSPLFMEHLPRLSLNKLFNETDGLGVFKEFYLAFDWVYDRGDERASRSNVLYSGLGADLDTNSDLILQLNLYAKRVWENYSMTNENSWDGYRAQVNFSKPLMNFSNGGGLNLDGYINYDFKSRLDDEDSYVYADKTLTSVARLVYRYKHFSTQASLYYFKDGANYRDGQLLDYGDGAGPFKARTTGFGYAFGIGYVF